MSQPPDIDALARGGRTNVAGFVLRLFARIPFLFIAGRLYGADRVGRFAIAVVVIELAALLATFGLKRGLAQALASDARDANHIVWDGAALATLVALGAAALLCLFPEIVYPNSKITGLDRWLPLVVLAPALSDVSLAALAWRRNVAATVTARAVVEPWTISVAAWLFHYATLRDGLLLSYVASMAAALTASLVPFVRSYGWPTRGWRPHPARLAGLARANVPLAGADAIEWGTRNVDRFILGLLFAPKLVGIYYMAQQVASLPQKLKTSFDPILGPVVTAALAEGNRAAVAAQVRQVAFWIVAAQLLLALMGSIPGEGVMGLVGAQFVAGTLALAFLLFAEVLASPGAVSESALVYVARHRNLLVSAAMLALQIVLSFAIVALMRRFGATLEAQVASVAIALMLSVALGSVVRTRLLARLLGASVQPGRPRLLLAALPAALVGGLFTLLPHRFEWAELAIGEPAIALTYLALLWTMVFTPADRALFARAQPAGRGMQASAAASIAVAAPPRR